MAAAAVPMPSPGLRAKRHPTSSPTASRIAQPFYFRDNAILSLSRRFEDLSRFVSAPVIVTSPRSGVYLFQSGVRSIQLIHKR